MSGPVTACLRCGIKRQARPESILCADCRWVLTAAEYELWKPETRRAA